MSTLEDKTITLSQNVRNQLPVMKHCIPDEWTPQDTRFGTGQLLCVTTLLDLVTCNDGKTMR
jgi:hypothetical protein